MPGSVGAGSSNRPVYPTVCISDSPVDQLSRELVGGQAEGVDR
ncbi:hypothetical protein [Halomonas sp. AOP35-4E-18]